MRSFLVLCAALITVGLAVMYLAITGDSTAVDDTPVTTPDGHIAPPPGYVP